MPTAPVNTWPYVVLVSPFIDKYFGEDKNYAAIIESCKNSRDRDLKNLGLILSRIEPERGWKLLRNIHLITPPSCLNS